MHNTNLTSPWQGSLVFPYEHVILQVCDALARTAGVFGSKEVVIARTQLDFIPAWPTGVCLPHSQSQKSSIALFHPSSLYCYSHRYY